MLVVFGLWVATLFYIQGVEMVVVNTLEKCCLSPVLKCWWKSHNLRLLGYYVVYNQGMEKLVEYTSCLFFAGNATSICDAFRRHEGVRDSGMPTDVALKLGFFCFPSFSAYRFVSSLTVRTGDASFSRSSSLLTPHSTCAQAEKLKDGCATAGLSKRS
ncbi:hypothetical protein AVEN_138442-1 [Araneus ventricosus]|uniref:Uncharacterized protein n=1 Tax=Araneus ventricosus TaxID=182803 RepID=A0A4Y2CEM1_ARAVE|nr:hypothetical protein AVEN_138442-1 [Araneus ventricosus]